MALKDLLTDLSSFYKDNPYQAKYKTKAGPVNALETPFNQRSLKFGNDRPGGGSSKQPFIQQPLPGVNSDPNAPFPDFLLRDPKNALNDRVDDLKRIGKFLLTTEGLLFVAKQQLLSLQNPIVPGRPNRSTPISGLYNPLLTLAQVGAAGTGLHLERQGLFPIFSNTDKYAYIYKTDHSEEANNRLTILYNLKLNTKPPKVDPLEAKKLGISTNSDLILSYLGGPNVGISGKTNIGFASDRIVSQLKRQELLVDSNNKAKIQAVFNYTSSLGVSIKAKDLGFGTIQTGVNEQNDTTFLNNGNNIYLLTADSNTIRTSPSNTTGKGAYTFTQQQLLTRTPIGKGGSTSLTNIPDFRRTIRETFTEIKDQGIQDQQGLVFFDYPNSKINREQRVGLGNPGKRTRDRSKLTSYDNDTIDRINILPLYVDRAVLDPDNLTRDMVKFRFEVINNADPGESTFIHFRAFLGAINDSFKADWSSTKYIGRGENFYNYNGFSRDISFSFKVHPQSRAEMKSIYQKLNYLASSLAPDYTGGYMKGNLIRLTIGDYFYIVPGFISNLTYSIPEEASWEISLTEPEGGVDTGTMETPKFFDVNVSFTPIHDFVPQIGATRDTAFITNPTGKGGKNQYLDGSKIYFFNNQTNAVSNPNKTVLYSDKMLKEKTIDPAPNPANLKNYATNGSTPIQYKEAPQEKVLFTGQGPVPSNATSFG